MNNFNPFSENFYNNTNTQEVQIQTEEKNESGVHAQQRTTRRKRSKKDKLKEKLQKKLEELRKLEEEKKKLAQELKKIEEEERKEQDKKLAKAAREAHKKGLTTEALQELKQAIKDILGETGDENETY